MIDTMELWFGIAKIADRADAWEVFVRTLVLGFVLCGATGALVHLFHRRGTSLAEREVKIVERERALADTERDHAVNNQRRAEAEREEQRQKWKESERMRINLEGRLETMRQDNEEKLREANASAAAFKSGLDNCAKEVESTNGPGYRFIWDASDHQGVRIILITKEHAVQLDGKVVFLGKPNVAEWMPQHFRLPS